MTEQDLLLLKKGNKDGLFSMSLLSPEFVPLFLTDEKEKLRKNPQLAEMVVEDIIHRKLKGKDESFIELIDLLISQNNFWQAFYLCIYALTVCRQKGDIYAGLIESLIELGISTDDTTSVRKIVDNEYDKYETFRFCRAICHLFLDWAKGCSEKNIRYKNVEEGLKYAEKLKSLNPRNEQGYYFEIRLLSLKDETFAARKLQRIVKCEQPRELFRTSMDSSEELMCPECCRLFVSIFSQHRTDAYTTLIDRSCKKGIRDARFLLRQELAPQDKRRIEKLIDFFDNELRHSMTYSNSFEAMYAHNIIESKQINNLLHEEELSYG